MNVELPDDSEIWQCLVSDNEVFELATQHSISSAGALLDHRIDPGADLASPGDYWRLLRKELVELCCTESPRYEVFRSAARATQRAAVVLTVPGVAEIVSKTLGLPVPPAALTPFVALFFAYIRQIGLSSFCGQSLRPDNERLTRTPPRN